MLYFNKKIESSPELFISLLYKKKFYMNINTTRRNQNVVSY